MRVALVVPTYEYLRPGPTYLAPSDFPVGLAYLAAALKKAGHEVIGLNVNNHPAYPSKRAMLEDQLRKMLERDRPELIGLGGLCADYAFIRDAIAIARSVAPRTPIVCGGGIITHDAEFVFNALRPDYCIRGEAEEALVQLVDHLATGKPALLNIPNLGFWHDGKAMFTPENYSYPSLESRPWPDYSPFSPDTMLACSTHGARLLYRYSRPNPRVMPFVAARNCPFKCTFCVHEQGPRYSARPMSDIFAELEHLYETYHFNILIILDELFAINKDRLREFCEGILERQKTLGWDFDWLFQTHASVGLTLEDMKLARKAGCYYFSYGIESASPKVLASMKKKVRPSQIKEAIELSAQAGIGFGGNLIFGDMAETPETIAESLSFMVNNCLDMQIWTGAISPYPGSLLFDYCLQQGLIKSKLDYYETIDRVVYNMTGMPDKAWAEWLGRVVYPLSTAPFVIAVEPLDVTDDPGETDWTSPPIRKVRAVCPHCSTEQVYRHPIDASSIADGTANLVPGCPNCGKRFRIQFRKGGGYSGAVLGRQVGPAQLMSVIQDSLVPLTRLRKRFDVLLIAADDARWQAERSNRYLSVMALEEGFAANGLSFVTVAALQDQAPGDPASWLSHLTRICSNKTFDQVWVDVVDAPLDDTILAFINSVAPVKVALIGKPMQFSESVHRVPAELKAARRTVEKRLRSMTHALACDEHDAAWLKENKKLASLWWLPAIPQRLVRPAPGTPTTNVVHLRGASAESFAESIAAAEPKATLQAYRPSDHAGQAPQLLEQAHRQASEILGSGAEFSDRLFELHADARRQFHRVAQESLIEGLTGGLAQIVVLSEASPALADILQGMAAACPVIAVLPASHPRLASLFVANEDILVANDPAEMAAHLARLASEPSFAARIAAAAAERLLRRHSAEQRMAEVRRWLADGTEPAYEASIERPRASVAKPAKAAKRSAPAKGNDLQWRVLNFVSSVQDVRRLDDPDTQLLLLKQATQNHPENRNILDLHDEVEKLQKQDIHQRIRSAWSTYMNT